MIQHKLRLLKRVSQYEQAQDRAFLAESPMTRTARGVKKLLDIAMSYRVGILRNLKVFEKMSDIELLNIAQNMEESIYFQGDVIIRQDDIGDALFVIEEGTVNITVKENSRDPNEEPRLLASVGKNSLFGERFARRTYRSGLLWIRSLINREPRSATVTVSSDMAKVLRMTKETFDSMIETSNKLTGETRESIARDVVRRLPLLKSFSMQEREDIFRAMTHVSFMQGNYVFRQGSVGNHFYIVTEGLLAVTINNEKGKEREVGRLHPGDYFGELALLGSNSKRTANVYAVENCNLMCLSRNDFGKFLGNLKDEMLQNNATKHVQMPKRKTAVSFAGKRRISGYGVDNIPKDKLIDTLVVRLLKFFSVSLWNSMYFRLYREITLVVSKSSEYGDIANEMQSLDLDRADGVDKLSKICFRILGRKSEERSIDENMLIVGLFRQRNDLKNKYTVGWPNHRFNIRLSLV